MRILHKYIFFIFVLCQLFVGHISGQDAHFSQYNAAPLLLNPAKTGNIFEDWRTILNYRKQWTSLGSPFITNALSFDKPFHVKNQKLGIGGVLVRDNVVNMRVQKTEFLVSVAYKYIFSNNIISIGIQPGVSNIVFDESQMTLPEQYNMYTSLYDPNMPITEDNISFRSSNFNLNIGFQWNTIIKTWNIESGLALSHINFPKISWGNEEHSLSPRIMINTEIGKEIVSFLSFNAVCNIVKQQKADALLFGGTLNLILPWNNDKIKEIFFGTYFRSAIIENVDAFIITIGIKNCKQLDIHLAYDFNISGLRQATNHKGAFELAIVYKGLFHHKRNFEPPCIIN